MSASVVLGALAIGASLPLAWWATGRGKRGGLLARVSKRGEATTDMRELALAESAGQRVVLPAAQALAGRLRRVTPVGWIEAIERRVQQAGIGSSWPPEKFLAAQFVVAAGAGLLGVFLLQQRQSAAGLAAVALLMLLAIAGPLVWLDRLVARRQAMIQRELPDALDQITMAVEAGMGFEGALKRATAAGQGPLAHELSRVLKEMQIGYTRSQALRTLAERAGIPDIQTFVVAVVQAEENGLPITQVLRVQASELRAKRRQQAEEKAMRLPVKMIFPLGLCIFPALFIVLIGPGVIRIWRAIM